MATVTRNIAVLVDDVSGLSAVVSASYDDVALRLTRIRVNNPTSRDIVAQAIKEGTGRLYSVTYPAGQDTFITIPASPQADRIPVTIDSQGRIGGVEWAIRWA